MSMQVISDQHEHKEMKTILRYLKHGSRKTAEHTAPISDQCNDQIHNEVPNNEQTKLDNHRKHFF